MNVTSIQSQKIYTPNRLFEDFEKVGANYYIGDPHSPARDRWIQLGSLRLEDIIANSDKPIDQNRPFGKSKANQYIIGQIDSSGRCNGVGKEINNTIYEGQFVNGDYNGYGRLIYSNGSYYIGNWVNG